MPDGVRLEQYPSQQNRTHEVWPINATNFLLITSPEPLSGLLQELLPRAPELSQSDLPVPQSLQVLPPGLPRAGQQPEREPLRVGKPLPKVERELPADQPGQPQYSSWNNQRMLFLPK